MTRYSLPIIVQKDNDGYYAECPALQGCFTQGETYEEAVTNIRDAMQLHIQDRIECGEEIPIPEMLSVSTLEIVA